MTITLLSAPPPALTREQLAAISSSTPSSFEGIAPILKHKQENITFSMDPAFQGFSHGKGDLWITEGAVSFYSPSTSTGISIPYPHLTLHAISRAPLRPFMSSSSSASANEENPATEQTETNGDAPKDGGPCIYCQIDEYEVQESEDETQGETREVIIVPQDDSSLDKIFATLSDCAALHPPASTSSHQGLFGGLDPDSIVYADSEGNLAGPGIENDANQDADEQDEPAAGRQRSDFVGNTRPGPY